MSRVLVDQETSVTILNSDLLQDRGAFAKPDPGSIIRALGDDEQVDLTPEFTALFARLQDMHKRDFVHRAGFKLSEGTPCMAVKHAATEILEIVDAMAGNGDINKTTEEIADTLLCLMNLMTYLRISPQDLMHQAHRKLSLRFKPNPAEKL